MIDVSLSFKASGNPELRCRQGLAATSADKCLQTCKTADSEFKTTRPLQLEHNRLKRWIFISFCGISIEPQVFGLQVTPILDFLPSIYSLQDHNHLVTASGFRMTAAFGFLCPTCKAPSTETNVTFPPEPIFWEQIKSYLSPKYKSRWLLISQLFHS